MKLETDTAAAESEVGPFFHALPATKTAPIVIATPAFFHMEPGTVVEGLRRAIFSVLSVVSVLRKRRHGVGF